LQPKLALGDRGKEALLLRFASMAQQRPHNVHLRMRRPRIAAARIDRFEDHGSSP
jgi:hypothetical protein